MCKITSEESAKRFILTTFIQLLLHCTGMSNSAYNGENKTCWSLRNYKRNDKSLFSGVNGKREECQLLFSADCTQTSKNRHIMGLNVCP